MVNSPVVVEELSSRASRELNLVDFPPLPKTIQPATVCVGAVPIAAAGVGTDVGGSPVAANPVVGTCIGTKDWNLADQSLPFFPNDVLTKDGRVVVKPSKEVLQDGAKQWENALLANFLVETVTTDHVLVFDSIVDSAVVLASGAIDTIDIVDTGFNDIVVAAEVTGDVACLDKGNDSDDLKHFTVDDSTVVTGTGISYPNNVEGQELSPRKCRIAAGGVVDLLNQLKPKAKGKHKKKGGKADGPSYFVT
ncbi:hypothetical protein V6N12_002023 [Hibiscus sabdariffa]|uniref:Uncharacterized protein n=1 Tax=Hibiscus sabdariffa TaxID=183260 RepID=A0ABR2B5X4_9ROSI